MLKEWLSNEDLAEHFQVPVDTIRTWRYRGDGPEGVRFGRHVRYHRDAVARWIEERQDAEKVATAGG